MFSRSTFALRGQREELASMRDCLGVLCRQGQIRYRGIYKRALPERNFVCFCFDCGLTSR